jgi:bile acid:Na+ symporter, BASS family
MNFAEITSMGCPHWNSVSALQSQLHAGCVLEPVRQHLGTESYIAALAGPFIGLGCGYLLVSSLRVKDMGIRHATETTTAVRNIAQMLLMMIFPFAADPLVTVSITILNTVGIVIVLLFVLMWRRAASPSDTHATTSQPD